MFSPFSALGSYARFAGIAAALLLYLANNVLVNLYTKYVFQVYAFNFPIIITLAHQACVYLVLRFLTAVCVISWPDPATIRSLSTPCLAIGIVFGLNIMCNTASLVYIDLSLNQCIKALAPAFGLVFFFLHTRKLYPPLVYTAAAATVIGAALSIMGNPSFKSEGVALAFASTIMAASQNCVASLVLSAKPKAIIHMTMYNALVVCYMGIPLAMYMELSRFHEYVRKETQDRRRAGYVVENSFAASVASPQ